MCFIICSGALKIAIWGFDFKGPLLRKHEISRNYGLANLYGRAPNAIKTSRNHFDRMIKACEKDIPKKGWLFGKSPSVADIIFVSCLIPCDLFNIKIKSERVLEYYRRAKQRNIYINAYNECFGS